MHTRRAVFASLGVLFAATGAEAATKPATKKTRKPVKTVKIAKKTTPKTIAARS